MLSWQEQYLTSSLRLLVRYCSCRLNIKCISSRHRVILTIYLVRESYLYHKGCSPWKLYIMLWGKVVNDQAQCFLIGQVNFCLPLALTLNRCVIFVGPKTDASTQDKPASVAIIATCVSIAVVGLLIALAIFYWRRYCLRYIWFMISNRTYHKFSWWFTILSLAWDRTSGCKGASCSRHQFISDLIQVAGWLALTQFKSYWVYIRKINGIISLS